MTSSKLYAATFTVVCFMATCDALAQSNTMGANQRPDVPICETSWTPFEAYTLNYGKHSIRFDDIESMVSARERALTAGQCILPSEAQLPSCGIEIRNGSVFIGIGNQMQSLFGDYERLIPLRERISVAVVAINELNENWICKGEAPSPCSVAPQPKTVIWRSWNIFDFDGYVVMRGLDVVEKYRSERDAMSLLSSLRTHGLCARLQK